MWLLWSWCKSSSLGKSFLSWQYLHLYVIMKKSILYWDIRIFDVLFIYNNLILILLLISNKHRVGHSQPAWYFNLGYKLKSIYLILKRCLFHCQPHILITAELSAWKYKNLATLANRQKWSILIAILRNSGLLTN